MKRVLLIGSLDAHGGVGHMIFEYCKNINRKNICFDFLYYKDIAKEEKEIIASCHGTFYKVPRYTRHPIQFYKEIKKIFRMQEYDIVHIHASTAMLMMYALPVWKAKKTKIFYQSHSDCVEGIVNKIMHFAIRHPVVKYASALMAVSQSAARFMYGRKKAEKTIILKNGIDIKKYEFCEEKRERVRRDLGIKDNFVLGHVGRFTYAKNHPFIIAVFEQIQRENEDARLLLAGAGEEEDKIRLLVQEKNLTEKVIFYGVSNCVEELLCAMDCFIFPSHYAGLGIADVEAQANGLLVVASSCVPEEVNVTELYHTLSLSDDSAKVWAKAILAFQEKKTDRRLRYKELAESGYDIEEAAGRLERIYQEA